MISSNALQLLAAAAGMSAGVVLALFYDLFAPLRGLMPHTTASALDVCYLLVCGALLFALGQGAGGGTVHLYYLLSSVSGALLYAVLMHGTINKWTSILFEKMKKNIKSLNKRLFANKKADVNSEKSLANR